jgi:serine protease Do
LIVCPVDHAETPPGASGFVVGDGAVLTASAVVDGSAKVEVRVGSGEWVEAVVAGLDRDFGLALLRAPVRAPALAVDRSAELEPGRLVVVPAGGGSGVDLSIVASRSADDGSRGLARLPRALAPGATGGVALGPDGRVRGLVASAGGVPVGEGCASCHTSSQVAWASRGAATTFFDMRPAGPGATHAGVPVAHLVPGRRIGRALDGLLADGRVKKAYLGLVLGAASDGEPVDERRIARLLPGSPAEGALRAGDRIVAVAGRRLAAHDDVSYEILALEPGKAATVRVERSDGTSTSEVDVEVTPTERTEDASARGAAVFGFDVVGLAPELKVWLGVSQDGVVVSGVTSGATADRAGLQRGDVLVTFAGRTVTTAADVTAAVDDALRRLAAGEPVTAEVMRDGKATTVTLLAR